MIVLINVIAVLVFSACAGQGSHPFPGDLEAAQRRVYAGVTPNRILGASKLVFDLAGEYNINITRQGNSLVASRHLNLGMSSWSEQWRIDTQVTNIGVEVTVVTQQDNSGIKMIPHTTGPYELFFARLDYLLGQAETWTTCDQYSRAYEAYKTWHYEGYLCLFAEDNAPTGPLALARRD